MHSNKPPIPTSFLPIPATAHPHQQGMRVVHIEPPTEGPRSLSLRVTRLYQDALAAYPFGVRALAEAAYGPFGLDPHHKCEQALHRIESLGLLVLQHAFVEELRTVQVFLREADMLEVLRYMLDTVYPRVNRALQDAKVDEGILLLPGGNMLRPVNAAAYCPPAPEGVRTFAKKHNPLTNAPFYDRPIKGEEAIITIRIPNRVTLSKAVLASIPHLSAGCPVDLVPPPRRGGVWHLDTRPTATRRLPKSPTARAEFATGYRVNPQHFEQVQGNGVGQGFTKEPKSRLHFTLGEALVPGYYALLPVGTSRGIRPNPSPGTQAADGGG